MSIYHSDKCTKEELERFKKELISWLSERFDLSGMRIRAFRCYNGDVRIYTGTMEYVSDRVSFRRQSQTEENGRITYHGTRGHHLIKIPEYMSFNRDEFEDMKRAWNGGEEFIWWNDLIFRNLKKI